MHPVLSFLLFTAALLAPLCAYRIRARRWGMPVRVTVDPADPRPQDICGYLAEIAQRLDARPERLRVVFDGRNAGRRAIALDVDADRRLRVSVGGCRPKSVDLRGRWIPDHPVPLDLRDVVLYVEPVDANRFRVLSAPPFAVPVAVSLACALAATVGAVLLCLPLVATAAGIALGFQCAAGISRHAQVARFLI